MKNYTLFKHLSCLFTFLFVVIISIAATFSLQAATITSFPPEDFWVVDHTTPRYNHSTYPQDTVIGYYHKVDNEYQLTDTIPNMTVAIWNKNQIDLNQSWQFDLKLFFDTGMLSKNQFVPTGSQSRQIADGMTFVLHKFDTATTKNMIGGWVWYMGYGYTCAPGGVSPPPSNNQQAGGQGKYGDEFQAGTTHISPSFAVEFDTEYENVNKSVSDFNEGGDSVACHIAYLKDGNMTALPGTYQPMQNNWANIGVGDWFDVRIVWRKGYENDSAYYDLLTYMQEGPNTSDGPLLLRDSMRFNRLSEIIGGLEVDENCQALVTWGITSATCGIANHHMVDFVKLETAEIPPVPPLTAVITGSCDKIYNGPAGIIAPQPLSDDYSKETRDTIFRSADIIGCYETIFRSLASDTIKYTISCKDSLTDYACDYSFELNGVPAGSECKYYVNGSLVDSIIYDTNTPNNLWQFPLERFYFFYDFSANIKIVVNGVEYNFRISMEDNTIDFVGQLLLSPPPNILLDTDLRGATLLLDANTLAQSIQLPDLSDCSYNIGEHYSHAQFITFPSIDSNNVLSFELDTHACKVEFDMKLQCQCEENFVFHVENPSCYSYACEKVLIDTGSLSADNPFESAGTPPRLPSLTGTPKVFYHNVTAGAVLGSNITTITVSEISTSGSMKDTIIKVPPHEMYDVFVSFSQGQTHKTVSYKICATLDNGISCCDTFERVIHGFMDMKNSEIDVIMHANMRGADYILTPWINSPLVPPLYIAIYDEWGYISRVLYNGLPVSAEGTLYFGYGYLPNRLYNLVFQWGEYIKTVPILGPGVGTDH